MQRITEAIIREGFEREFGPLQDVGIRLHRVSSDVRLHSLLSIFSSFVYPLDAYVGNSNWVRVHDFPKP